MSNKVPCPACGASGWIPKQSRRFMMVNFAKGTHWFAFRTTVRRMCTVCNKLGRVTREAADDWTLRFAASSMEQPVINKKGDTAS